ncbi:MAG TPA: MarR family transcriptional regulator [Tepidisphaeraceae bacterium]|jgi:DNA-binding MarR family transcriptional regulator
MVVTKPTRSRAKGDRAAEPAFRSLIRTLGLLKRVMEPYFAKHGISGSQWAVLRNLNRAEEEGISGLRPGELSDRLLVRPPSVTGVIDRLQRMRLVTRQASDSDQRAKVVGLTDPGRRLVARVREGHAERVQDVLAGLSAAERRELDRLLTRLGDHLEELANHHSTETSAASEET